MIGIYQDSFGDYIRQYLGEYKVTSTNIICRCPWCEMGKKASHNHLYISLDKPIFNCFRAGCNVSGDFKLYDNKVKYLKSRLQFAQFDMREIHGLIFDFNQFVDINNLYDSLSVSDKKMQNYLQNNFIGFITENHHTIVFRNIDITSDFRYYKITLQKSDMLDYYKLSHKNINSNLIVIGEGIFDIFNDHIFDYLGYRDIAFGYYCSLNNRFESLIKSIAFYDNIYDPDVVILSDNNVSIQYYKKMKKRLKNICSSINLFYNLNGKDFGDTFCSPEKILL